jgi:hypothetical protein
VFFFEKKNQKTFNTCARPDGESVTAKSKVFCFFFSEKKPLFPLGGRAFPATWVFNRAASRRPPSMQSEALLAPFTAT